MTATPENVNVQRLKVDSRKFAVAKLSPRKYGDRVLTEQQQLGADGKPISPDFVVNIAPYPAEPLLALRTRAPGVLYGGAAGGGPPRHARRAARHCAMLISLEALLGSAKPLDSEQIQVCPKDVASALRAEAAED